MCYFHVNQLEKPKIKGYYRSLPYFLYKEESDV